MTATGGGVSYPFDYIDTGGLAITDAKRGCSGTPTWRLTVRGQINPNHVRAALADLAARYPILKCKAKSLNRKPPWSTRYRYAEDETFKLDGIFRTIDHRGNVDGVDALAREERSRPMDLFVDFPMTLTLAIVSDNECHLHFRQHHAIADGRAFIALLCDFREFLNLARAGERPSLEQLNPVERRSEVEALGLSGWRLFVETLAGFLVVFRIQARALLSPLVPLLQNRGDDYTGENATVHWILPDSVLETWKVARSRIGVSLNSMLTGALFVAIQRWHLDQKLPLGRTSSLVLQETRPRDRPFVSFANHLAFPEVELPLNRVASPDEAMTAIQRQMDQERKSRTAIHRLLAERWIIRFVPLIILKRIALHSRQPLQSTSFSNLISLAFPELGGDGWKVERVFITTPVQPHTGISLTAIRYGGQLVFNFNYKSSVVTREQTEALAARFRSVIEDFTGSGQASVRES